MFSTLIRCVLLFLHLRDFDHLDIVSLAGIARESNELSESIDVNTVTRGHLPEQVVRRPLEEGRHPQLQRRPPINPSS